MKIHKPIAPSTPIPLARARTHKKKNKKTCIYYTCYKPKKEFVSLAYGALLKGLHKPTKKMCYTNYTLLDEIINLSS